MAAKFKRTVVRTTAANRTNETPPAGAMVRETDTGKVWHGDGATAGGVSQKIDGADVTTGTVAAARLPDLSATYATAAQGALADSATQPGDNISTLTNDANYADDQTGAEIKVAYEGEADTNAFTDAEKAKVANVPADTNTALAGKSDTSHNHAGVYEPVLTAASQAEMEAGTQTALRSMSPLRVKQAIDALAPGGGAVDSVFGRTGAVAAVSGDYAASEVSNDSGVAGATVAAALDNVAAGAVSDAVIAASVDRVRPETILSAGDYSRLLADDRERRYLVRPDEYLRRTVVFNGASGLKRSSQPSTVADSKAGTVEALVKFTGGNAAKQVLMAGYFRFEFYKGTDNKLYVDGRNASDTLIMRLPSSTTYTDADGWLHVVASWDLTDTAKRHLYVNGVSVLGTVSTYTNDTIDHTRVTGIGNDGGGTPANFFVGLLERVGLWQSYMDLSDPAVMAMFGPGDTLADLGGDGILADGTAPAMFFRGPAADFPACRAGDYALDFTVLGTLTDGPSNKGYWHTVGRHLYGPDGRQGRLVGFRYGYDGAAVTTQDFVDYRDSDGVNFNCIAYELWWAMDNDTNPGEPTPSAPGVYNTLALVRAKEKMRAAVRAGLWVIPSLRVSWGTAATIAANLAADGDSGGNGWQGWADHAKLINDEAIAAPGTGNYKDRFFAWTRWIMSELLADPEIAAAIAYWELWHFPWHNQGGSITDTLADLYSDTFMPDMIAVAREYEPHRCLGVSYRHQNALTRAYGQAVNIDDPNLIYVTGGYGHHALLMESPGDTSEAWPPSGTDDGPKYSSGDSQFEFVLWSAAQNIAFHSQEGPGLIAGKQVEPLNASVKTFLEGLGTLYNTYAHGMCWHAWSNRPTAAAGTELGDIIRSETYFGGAGLYHEERQPTASPVHGDAVAVVLRPGVHNAYFNWLAIKAAIAECHRLGVKCLVLPAGDYYVDGSFKLAGTHTGLDSDNGSGLLVENWVIHGNGCNLIVPPSPTLANFEDQHSPVLDGSDYAFCSDFFVHDGEPWQWGPGINKSTKVGEGSFSASGSDFTYATGATVLGMAVENGGVMSRLLQVSRLDYDGETVTPTGTTAVGGTSGATARVVRIVDNGTTGELWLTSVKGTFQNNETVNLFDLAEAAAGTVVANGTLETQPTGLADGEWALNSGGVRVGTKTTGDTFWLVTNDAGNIIDQGGRLRDYKVFLDLCGTARVHFVGKLILTCRTDQDIIAIGTSRQGPKDSNGIKTGGRANIYDDIVIVDAPIGLSTNPIGGAVWDATTGNNEDGQFPSFSMAIFHKLTMSGVIRPFAINSDRGDSFRIGQMETTAIRARGHFHNINAQIDTWRGTFNSEADAGTSGQSGHDEPVLEVSSADVQIGSMFFHSSGATPATAGAYGLIHMANSSVFVGDLKHDNSAGRTNRPYLITMDNTLNGFSRGKVQRLHAVIDSNASLGNITGWLDAFVLLVTHSYTGTTRDSRNIYVEASMIEAADVPGIAISGSDTTKDLIEVSQRDTNQHYRVVAGALVACDGNGLRQNFTATTNPTATDDSTKHYGIGSPWVNTTLDLAWQCVDATAGAAVWKVTTAGDTELYAAAFGVVADGVLITDAAISSGDTELTSASNPFTAADVGKPIHVAGAGAAGVTLRTTIATYNSAGSVELTASASTTVSGAIAGWGTDNATAMIAMRDYMIARRETDFTVHMQSGTTCYTNNRWLQDIGGVRLIGAGSKLQNLSANAWEANYRPFNNRMVWDADGDVPVDGDRPFYNGYGFADADIGDTTLTMTSSGDESNFSAGERVYIQGFCQQAGGYPPNPRYFEYNVIESIGSGTITLKNPIKHDYRDTEWFDQTYAVDAQNVTYGKARIMSLERAEWYFPRLIELNGIEIQTVDPAIVGAVTLAADKFVVVDCKTPALAIGMNRIAEIERTEVYAYSIEPDKNVEYCRIQDCDIVGVVEATGVEQLSILGNRILGKINSAPRVLVVERNQIWTTDTAGPIQLKAGSWAINHVSVKDNIIHDATTLNATVVIGASPSFTVGSAGANDEIKVTANTTNITNVVAKIVPGSFLYQSDLALYGRVLSIVDDGTDFVIDGTWEGTPSGTWYIAGPVQVSVEANSYPDGSPKSEIDYWKSPCLKEKGKGIVTMRKSDGWPFSTGYLIKNQLLGIIDEVRIYSTGLYTGVGSVPIIQFSLRVAGGSETNYISIYNGSSDGTAIAKASLERTFSTGSAVYSISNLPFSLADQLWLYFRDNVSAFSDASDESVMPSFTVEIDIIPIG